MGSKALCSIVQIQRRKYSFEKKVSYVFIYIKVFTYRSCSVVFFYNHHQFKKGTHPIPTTFIINVRDTETVFFFGFLGLPRQFYVSLVGGKKW